MLLPAACQEVRKVKVWTMSTESAAVVWEPVLAFKDWEVMPVTWHGPLFLAVLMKGAPDSWPAGFSVEAGKASKLLAHAARHAFWKLPEPSIDRLIAHDLNSSGIDKSLGFPGKLAKVIMHVLKCSLSGALGVMGSWGRGCLHMGTGASFSKCWTWRM